jgi:hypothetical protein
LALYAPLLPSGVALGCDGGHLSSDDSLSFQPVAAEYSSALDRIAMISASPNQLHIYSPVSQSDAKVPK